jgi:hypothetical protein
MILVHKKNSKEWREDVICDLKGADDYWIEGKKPEGRIKRLPSAKKTNVEAVNNEMNISEPDNLVTFIELLVSAEIWGFCKYWVIFDALNIMSEPSELGCNMAAFFRMYITESFIYCSGTSSRRFCVLSVIYIHCNMNASFSFDLFMVYIPECKQQLRTNKTQNLLDSTGFGSLKNVEDNA